MGASGKPAIAYRFADHARYLDAWFDALGLAEPILVGHDWGGALAMDFAARHPGRVAGVAVAETFLRPMRWSELPPRSAEMFRLFRSPAGERAVLTENKFVEYNLPALVPAMAEADLDAYRAPYPTPASRAAMLAWAREFPLDGAPVDVVNRVDAYGAWMTTSVGVPKLLMTVEPAVGLGGAEIIDWAAATFADLEVESVGPGSHHAPEDQPEAIGKSVSAWLDRHHPAVHLARRGQAAHLGLPGGGELPDLPAPADGRRARAGEPRRIRRRPARRAGRRGLPRARSGIARRGGPAQLHPGDAAVPEPRRAHRLRPR
ncbi:haloalkane dehalogenase [Nocardia asteroides]|uniref:haloalkane dehalogenase n=1 Tax=Nocardia asteroides TaxID=1824 RepID=UPI00379FB872